ncbi:hypothetical protein pb186bvf_007942 [Paramecium bursaria]
MTHDEKKLIRFGLQGFSDGFNQFLLCIKYQFMIILRYRNYQFTKYQNILRILVIGQIQFYIKQNQILKMSKDELFKKYGLIRLAQILTSKLKDPFDFMKIIIDKPLSLSSEIQYYKVECSFNKVQQKSQESIYVELIYEKEKKINLREAIAELRIQEQSKLPNIISNEMSNRAQDNRQILNFQKEMNNMEMSKHNQLKILMKARNLQKIFNDQNSNTSQIIVAILISLICGSTLMILYHQENNLFFICPFLLIFFFIII